MNIGAVFQEDGMYKMVFKLGTEGWPQVRKFNSLQEMLDQLRYVGVPFDQLRDFVLEQLQCKTNLLRELPGNASDWAHFAG